MFIPALKLPFCIQVRMKEKLSLLTLHFPFSRVFMKHYKYYNSVGYILKLGTTRSHTSYFGSNSLLLFVFSFPLSLSLAQYSAHCRAGLETLHSKLVFNSRIVIHSLLNKLLKKKIRNYYIIFNRFLYQCQQTQHAISKTNMCFTKN